MNIVLQAFEHVVRRRLNINGAGNTATMDANKRIRGWLAISREGRICGGRRIDPIRRQTASRFIYGFLTDFSGPWINYIMPALARPRGRPAHDASTLFQSGVFNSGFGEREDAGVGVFPKG